MKLQRIVMMLAAFVVVLVAVPAIASATSVRLHNQDSRTWKLYVKHKGSSVHTTIGPRTVTNICSGPCTIVLKDSGASLAAGPGDLVIIKDGRLTKR